ncbi:protein-export membrane protein SecD [Candidatus Nomurabacteria bacterium RIFCSPLOWO2_01_FULL_46_18]|uniref:Protein translocase subunit SecD n=1 Tax=Candidatus Nomurabacteria bacterium RIFCSPLOWO2_01_FULL_46_18 TaxID=1801783 RepID=A0A1F6XCS7_9BACT|nr:MAG: protein-export membrane protein SecD [Candidatus Nomurabacteria bacterium RIFCSPLOWO2_01_FULL_46_18]
MRSRKHIYISAITLLLFVGLGYFLVIEERPGARFPFSFGLDLVGGTELVYTADTSNVSDVGGAMESLKEVIERRVNIFGVSEPLVQTESAGLVSGHSVERLIVGLPGVTNIDKAIELIGQTPVLEFRLAKPDTQKIVDANPKASIDELFTPTGLTGRYLSRAVVEFNPNTGAASVGLEFDKDGSKLFTDVTSAHKGEVLAIILDGAIISAPVIVDEISDGKAEITGSFTPTEAKELVRNLNYGALPVPITLSTSQIVGATLGEVALNAGVRAGIIGFVVLSLFLILWYRLPGLVSVVALICYVIISLIVFKLIPVTLTAAGLAGFILSIGMAVDANVLIFERMKEELRKGQSIYQALHEGFSRAWLSIRDSNISSIITAVILFWLGTSAVKGFALTLGVGVMVSMLTAISISRTFLFAVAPATDTPSKKFLFSNGLHK